MQPRCARCDGRNTSLTATLRCLAGDLWVCDGCAWELATQWADMAYRIAR